MSENISSLSILEDRIVWIQGSVLPDQIAIEQFVETELPFQLSKENIARTTSTIQIANQLSYLAKANKLDTQNVRVSIPARFGIVKRVWVDDAIPEEQWRAFAQSQIAAELIAPLDEYVFYLSKEKHTVENHSELLVVLFPREMQAFFKKIAAESQIRFSHLIFAPFGVEELFRQLYGNLLGTSQLINVTARGLETTFMNETHFLQSIFYPFPQEESTEDQFVKTVELCLSDVMKREELGGGGIGDVTGIFLYGYHFQPEWQERLQEIAKVPAQVISFSENAALQINPGTTDFPVDQAFQYLDALGNLFI